MILFTTLPVTGHWFLHVTKLWCSLLQMAEENPRVIPLLEAFVNEDLLTNKAENPDVSRGKTGSSG